MSQILIELIKLANLIITMTKAVACGNRISALLEEKSSLPLPENPQQFQESENAVQFIGAS